MTRYRSILVLLLAMVMTLVVSCSSPTAKAPSTYTNEQITQIQRIASTLSALRGTMPVLEGKINKQNWTDVRAYIHGPLGDLRRELSYLTSQFLPQDKKVALAASKDLSSRLQNIDTAAVAGNYQKAIENYRAAVKDLDEVLQLIPKESRPVIGDY